MCCSSSGGAQITSNEDTEVALLQSLQASVAACSGDTAVCLPDRDRTLSSTFYSRLTCIWVKEGAQPGFCFWPSQASLTPSRPFMQQDKMAGRGLRWWAEEIKYNVIITQYKQNSLSNSSAIYNAPIRTPFTTTAVAYVYF